MTLTITEAYRIGDSIFAMVRCQVTNPPIDRTIIVKADTRAFTQPPLQGDAVARREHVIDLAYAKFIADHAQIPLTLNATLQQAQTRPDPAGA